VRQVLNALADAVASPLPTRWFVADRKLVHEPTGCVASPKSRASAGSSHRALVRLDPGPSLTEAEPLGIDHPAGGRPRARRLSRRTAISVEYSCIPAARLPGLESIELTDCSLYRSCASATTSWRRGATTNFRRVGGPGGQQVARIAEGAPVLVGYR